MTFPDCRIDENYNEDFLNNTDKKFIEGFDYALECITNVFNNLDVYENELANTKKGVGNFSPSSTKNLKDILESNTELLTEIINQWHEVERDEIITSMIDNMDEKDYNELKAKAIAEHPDKKYVDSRSFKSLSNQSKGVGTVELL